MGKPVWAEKRSLVFRLECVACKETFQQLPSRRGATVFCDGKGGKKKDVKRLLELGKSPGEKEWSASHRTLLQLLELIFEGEISKIAAILPDFSESFLLQKLNSSKKCPSTFDLDSPSLLPPQSPIPQAFPPFPINPSPLFFEPEAPLKYTPSPFWKSEIPLTPSLSSRPALPLFSPLPDFNRANFFGAGFPVSAHSPLPTGSSPSRRRSPISAALRPFPLSAFPLRCPSLSKPTIRRI